MQPSSRRATYEAAVSLLILEVHTLFDLPLPESERPAPGIPSEMEQKVAFWTNALIRTVPHEDLRPALDYTIDHHTKERAINAMDIKQGYNEMVVEREHKRRGEEASVEALMPCGTCANSRAVEIWFPSCGEAVILPCQSCRPKAFTVAREQWMERRREAPPEGSVELVKKAADEMVSDAEN